MRAWHLQVATISLLISSPCGQALPPAWWSSSTAPVVTDPSGDNKSVATVAQGKWMAQCALSALEEKLGTDSPSFEEIREQLFKPSAEATTGVFYPVRPATPSAAWLEEQKAPLTIGALKALAAPFYHSLSTLDSDWLRTQLEDNGLVSGSTYFESGGILTPWNPADNGNTERNSLVSTTGQLKLVFSLRFESFPADDDGDGLTNEWEIAHGLNPTLVDTDGDGLNDKWEVDNGLDATDNGSVNPVNGANGDADGDGVSNKKEADDGTNPQQASDFLMQIVSLGRSSEGGNRAVSWNGWESGQDGHEFDVDITPALMTQKASSNAFPASPPLTKVTTEKYGTSNVSSLSVFLANQNGSGEGNVHHTRVWLRAPAVNFPRTFTMILKTHTTSFSLGSPAVTTTAPLETRQFTIPANSDCSDPVDLLPEPPSTVDVRYTRVVNLIPIDMDIVHPVGGSSATVTETAQRNPAEGGLVAVKRGDFNFPPEARNEPVTQLRIAAMPDVTGLKWRLRFNGGTNFRIWKDLTLTQPVQSEVTEFDGTADTVVYFEGVSKSSAVGAQTVELLPVLAGNASATAADIAYFTVVEAQIFVQLRFWIREGWFSIPWHPVDNPLANRIASGDGRDASLLWEPGSGQPPLDDAPGYRATQEIVIQPFKELNPSLFPGTKQESAKNRSGLSALFTESSVPSPSAVWSATNEINSTAVPIVVARPDTSRMHFDTARINNRTGQVRFYGAVNDPVVHASPDVDWSLTVAIDSSDPLKPMFRIEGNHDSYPAVEVNMKFDGADPAPTTTPFTTVTQPYSYLHSLPSKPWILIAGYGDKIVVPPTSGEVK